MFRALRASKKNRSIRFSRPAGFTLFFFIVSLLCRPLSASANQIIVSSGASSASLNAALPAEYSFAKRKHSHAASNNIFYVFVFEDKWVCMIDLFLYSYGLFEKWGMYAVLTDPDGNSFFFKNELQKDRISLEKDTLYVSDGSISIEGLAPHFRIRCDYEDFSCDLRIRNYVPPLKEGDGYHYVNQDKTVFVQRIMTTPFGLAEGYITSRGNRREVRGGVYGDKSFLVFPPLRLDPLIVSLRLFETESEGGKGRQFNLLEHESHKYFGGKRFPLLWVMNKEGIVLAADNYTADFNFPSHGTGLREYPESITIRAQAGDAYFEGIFKVSVLFNTTDVMEEIPEILRPLASLIFKRPVFYRCLGVLRGSITHADGRTEEVEFYGPLEYVVVK